MLKLKDVAIAPETPKPKEAFSISGEVELFGIRFLGPAWVTEIILESIPSEGLPVEPIVARKVGPIFAGSFKSEFPGGLDEGTYKLRLGLYLGPETMRDTTVLPPFPTIDTYETTFVVSEVPVERTTLAITVSYSKPEYKRGETVEATVTVRNTGSITARNAAGSVIIKTPAGAPWLTIDFPKQDIAPGASPHVTGTKVIASTDPLGTYTHSGSVRADNAPEATVSGSAFRVSTAPPEQTTISATVSYSKA